MRTRAPEVAEALAEQVVRLVQRLRQRRRPPQAAGRGRDARLGPRAGRARRRRARPRDRGRDHRAPRVKYREDAGARARRRSTRMLWRDDREPTPRRGAARLRPRPARGRAPGHGRPRARSSRRSPWSARRRAPRRLLGGPRHAVLRPGRPRALRPGVRRLVHQRPTSAPRRARDHAAVDRLSLDVEHRRRRCDRAGEELSSPSSPAPSDRGAAAPRRRRPQPPRSGAGSPRLFAGLRRRGCRTGAGATADARTGGATSTRAARCATSCGGAASPARSRGRTAALAPAGWCCSSTSPAR